MAKAASPVLSADARAAARRNRFWRACNKAFLPIHLVALAIVGFMVGDGWLFWLVAASIVVGPVLSYFDHVYGDAELPAAEQQELDKAES